MHREHQRWYSPALGRDMDLLVVGHAGARAIVFPTSMGRFYDWDDRGMFGPLAEQLEQGWLQVYCVDSVDGESWYARTSHPADRARRHLVYDRYLADELVPFTAERNPNPYLITAGASFGAYHAVTFALRHPRLVDRTIGLSGLYDVKGFAAGYFDDNVYFNSPCDFIPGEHDAARLDALRRLDIILAIGRDDPSCPNNEELSAQLAAKAIPHRLRIWDGWAHDWPWWQRMIGLYISGDG